MLHTSVVYAFFFFKFEIILDPTKREIWWMVEENLTDEIKIMYKKYEYRNKFYKAYAATGRMRISRNLYFVYQLRKGNILKIDVT